MAEFHTLTVTDVRNTTRDAVVLTLQAPEAADFRFDPGQYLTFRRVFDGQELRRSYSLCNAADDGALQVGIKRVDGGAFSTWANTELSAGDTLEAMAPMGQFLGSAASDSAAHYLCVAAGSGITPILSIVRSLLSANARARFTLIYGNRNSSAVMFRDELADLKDLYLERLNIIHVFSEEATDIELFRGRIDADKCAALFAHWVDVSALDAAWICGPESMMHACRDALIAHGMPDTAIRIELFASAQPGRLSQPVASDANRAQGIDAEITLDGETRRVKMDSKTSLLQAALAERIDAPYACCAGVCSTCRARVVEGDVEMLSNHALQDDEVEQGFVLTCQSYVRSDRVVVNYDDAGH